MTTTRRLLPLATTLCVLMASLALAVVTARIELALVACLAVVVAVAVTTGVREVTAAVDAMPVVPDVKTPQAVIRAWFHRTFGALEDSNFRAFYLGNIMQFGSMQMQQVVRGYLVFHITGSFAALGTMALANAIPSLIGSPIGGVVADRATKKTVIQVGQAYNVINAALLVVLAAGWFGLHLAFWHLFVSAFLQGAVGSVMQPSRQSMISDIVPRERMMNAIGINSSGQTFMQLVGPGIAGFLIAAISPAAVFAVMGAMYALAIMFTLQLPSKPLYSFAQSAAGAAARERRGARGGGGLADLVEGMKYVVRDHRIRMLLLVNFLIVIVSLPYTQLLPGFVAAVLQRGPFEQGMLQSVQGIGALIGAVIVASAAAVRRGKMLIWAGALLGGAIVAFSISTNYWITMPIMVVLGFGQAQRMALGQVLIQEYAEEEYRGRVVSVLFMQFGLVQFGTFVVGILAHAFGPQLAIGGMAVMLLCTMGAVALLSPTIRDLD